MERNYSHCEYILDVVTHTEKSSVEKERNNNQTREKRARYQLNQVRISHTFKHDVLGRAPHLCGILPPKL